MAREIWILKVFWFIKPVMHDPSGQTYVQFVILENLSMYNVISLSAMQWRFGFNLIIAIAILDYTD